MNHFYKVTARTAAKDHECSECHTEIGAGDPYYEQRHCTDGNWTKYRFCCGCQELINRVCREIGRDQAMDLNEYVFGYHHPDEIALDEELLGFAVRWGRHNDWPLVEVLDFLKEVNDD